MLDLPLVVIGGGLADRMGAPFVARVEAAVQRELFPRNPALRVVPGELGDRGGAIGAALMAAERLSTERSS
jgi:predicted NBD/HSP70 family sugar kinase